MTSHSSPYGPAPTEGDARPATSEVDDDRATTPLVAPTTPDRVTHARHLISRVVRVLWWAVIGLIATHIALTLTLGELDDVVWPFALHGLTTLLIPLLIVIALNMHVWRARLPRLAQISVSGRAISIALTILGLSAASIFLVAILWFGIVMFPIRLLFG